MPRFYHAASLVSLHARASVRLCSVWNAVVSSGVVCGLGGVHVHVFGVGGVNVHLLPCLQCLPLSMHAPLSSSVWNAVVSSGVVCGVGDVNVHVLPCLPCLPCHHLPQEVTCCLACNVCPLACTRLCQALSGMQW